MQSYKMFIFIFRRLTGTIIHVKIFAEKSWNVTANVGLTNSIWYLRVGILDGAGYFFTHY